MRILSLIIGLGFFAFFSACNFAEETKSKDKGKELVIYEAVNAGKGVAIIVKRGLQEVMTTFSFTQQNEDTIMNDVKLTVDYKNVVKLQIVLPEKLVLSEDSVSAWYSSKSVKAELPKPRYYARYDSLKVLVIENLHQFLAEETEEAAIVLTDYHLKQKIYIRLRPLVSNVKFEKLEFSEFVDLNPELHSRLNILKVRDTVVNLATVIKATNNENEPVILQFSKQRDEFVAKKIFFSDNYNKNIVRYKDRSGDWKKVFTYYSDKQKTETKERVYNTAKIFSVPLSSQTLPFLEKAMFMENDSKYIIYPKESIYLGFYSNFDYTIDNSKEVRKLQFLPFSASFKCDGDDQIMTRTGYKQVLVGLTKTQIFFRKTALNPKIYYSDDLIGMSDNSTTKDFDTIINFVHTVNTTPKVDNKREPVKDRRNTEYCDEMNRSPNPLSLEVK